MAAFDVIVLGLGAVGSAATYHLSRLGASVLGIDQYSPPHSYGSSHGETRITRLAIGERIDYSALAIRSHTLWREIEAHTGFDLLRNCGCLIIAGRGTGGLHGVPEFFKNTLSAAAKYRIAHEQLDAPGIRERFAQFRVHDAEFGYLEREGGYLFPERCIEAQLLLAKRNGAAILTNQKVQRFQQIGRRIRVEASGGTYEADRLLIAAGPWLPDLLGNPYNRLFTVTRQVLHWFEIAANPERFSAPESPVFIWEVPEAENIYGFPAIGPNGTSVKIAKEGKGDKVEPDFVDRAVAADEIDQMYQTYVRPYLPDLGPRSAKAQVCLYTEAAGGRFVIDAHPDHERIMFASACSGHGFKHSAALGEALAEVLTDRRPSHVSDELFTSWRLDAAAEA